MGALSRFFDIIESRNIPLWKYGLSFLFIALIRNFLEIIASSNYFTLADNLHFILFYVALGLCLAPLLRWLTGVRIQTSIRLVLLGYIFIWAGPLIDLLLSIGDSPVIGYIWPGLTSSLLKSYFTFFGSGGWVGVTWGIRIELFGLIILFFLFVLHKSGWLRALLAVLLLYSLLFLFAATPFWLSAFYRMLHIMPPFGLTSYDFVYLFSFISLALLASLFAYAYPHYFVALLKDFRWERVLHFMLIFLLGAVIARNRFFAGFQFSTYALWGCLFTLVSLVFSILFAIITNNLEDRSIDAVSNPGRPSVQNAIPQKVYSRLAVIFFLLMIYSSAIVNWKLWFFVMIFTAVYYLYSVPPFRLKRIPVVSKVLIGFNTLMVFMLGYEYFTIYSVNVNDLFTSNKFLINFPSRPWWVFLVGFSLCANFIDIKDYEGDKAGRIRTIPGIIGLRTSRWLFALLFLVFYGCLFFLLNDLMFFVPLLCLGLFQFYFLAVKKRYHERYVFIIYLISMIIITIYYFNLKNI